MTREEYIKDYINTLVIKKPKFVEKYEKGEGALSKMN
jgi:hypothetical protein